MTGTCRRSPARSRTSCACPTGVNLAQQLRELLRVPHTLAVDLEEQIALPKGRRSDVRNDLNDQHTATRPVISCPDPEALLEVGVARLRLLRGSGWQRWACEDGGGELRDEDEGVNQFVLSMFRRR